MVVGVSYNIAGGRDTTVVLLIAENFPFGFWVGAMGRFRAGTCWRIHRGLGVSVCIADLVSYVGVSSRYGARR